MKCINCGSVKITIVTENLNDPFTWLAKVVCSDCGEIQATEEAHQILTEL